MFPYLSQLKPKASTQSQIGHRSRYEVSDQKQPTTYSKQHPLKLPQLGGPNEEYYRKEIQKNEKELQKAKLEDKELEKQIQDYQKKLNSYKQTKFQVKSSIDKLKKQELVLIFQLNRIQESKQNERGPLQIAIMKQDVGSIKQKIQSAEKDYQLIADKISKCQKNIHQLNRFKNHLAGNIKSLREYLEKLRDGIRMGPHHKYVK